MAGGAKPRLQDYSMGRPTDYEVWYKRDNRLQGHILQGHNMNKATVYDVIPQIWLQIKKSYHEYNYRLQGQSTESNKDYMVIPCIGLEITRSYHE